MADRDEIQRIAAAMNAHRPDWRINSLVTFLTTNLAGKAYRDLSIAATVVATDPQTKTPHLLLEHGAWWVAAQAATGTSTMTAIPGPHDTHCQVYGHEGYRLPCAGCRSEALAAGVDQLAPAVPAVTPRDASHAAHIRTLTREPDPRERAAGKTREED